jgi:hypothetical protein
VERLLGLARHGSRRSGPWGRGVVGSWGRCQPTLACGNTHARLCRGGGFAARGFMEGGSSCALIAKSPPPLRQGRIQEAAVSALGQVIPS